MVLALQILVALVILVGLIATIMSVKNWHWAQMLLLLCIFFSSIGTLFLGLEVYRIHRTVRSKIPPLEEQIAVTAAENDAFRRGTRDQALAGRAFAPEDVPFDFEAEGRMPGIDVWTHRLQVLSRQKGRVWQNAKPQGAIDPATGRIAVALPEPTPHGMEPNSIVFAFRQGEPEAVNPGEPPNVTSPLYLGEFRVVEAAEGGAVLESVRRLDRRAVATLANTEAPWRLYETMPADSHELFAELTEEQLRQMFPASSVDEYLRHGQPATDDDDQWHRAGFDEQGRRLGPDDAAQATEWRYDRPLRDYAYLFSELRRQRVVMLTEQAGLIEDNQKLAQAQVHAKKLNAHRTEEKQALGGDLEHLQSDRQAIETLRDAVQGQLAAAQRLVAETLADTSRLNQELIERQLGQLRELNLTAPAPGQAAIGATGP